MFYMLCLILFIAGLFGVLIQRNIVRMIISLAAAQSGVTLFLLGLAYRNGSHVADPVPQTMAIISIVISACTIGCGAAIAIRIHHKSGSYDMSEINKVKE